MRPVRKGRRPTRNRRPVVFSEYGEALPHLRKRLGDFCSYCGIRLPASLAVEHVQPKSRNPSLELDWDNFLLACASCNSIKGSQDVDAEDYYWPDRDNTMRCFTYGPYALMRVNEALSATEYIRANATLQLTGIDRVPGGQALREPSAKDFRWRERERAWELATKYHGMLATSGSDALRAAVLDLALARGCFPIWYTVFADDADMLARLRAGFPRTALDCFDSQGRPVSRPGGAL